MRSNDGEGEDGEGEDACGRRTLSVKACGFASSPKGELLDGVRNLTAPKKPLPLGEVALRSNDGEGKAVSKKKGVFHEGDDGC